MRHFIYLVVLKIIEAAKVAAIVYMSYDLCRWLVKYLARRYG